MRHFQIHTHGLKQPMPADLPLVADLLVNTRSLPNPHARPELRPLTGRHPAVRGWLSAIPAFNSLIESTLARIDSTPGDSLTIVVTCYGGRHRSVAVAEELTDRLRADGHEVTLQHHNI
jgi:RNase adapter protein RapZ